jgi:hypothetical protein
MRPGELWDPPRANSDQREYITELLASCSIDVGRVSALVIDQLADSYAAGASHMHGIIDAIRGLEGVAACTCTKAKQTTAFERAPLKGL